MIVELGHYALILALGLALLLSFYPLYGASKGHEGMMKMARPLSVGMFAMLLFFFYRAQLGFFTPTILPLPT